MTTITTRQRQLLAEMTSHDAGLREGRFGNDAIYVRNTRNNYPYKSLVALLKKGLITSAGCCAGRWTITDAGRALFTDGGL